MKDNIPDSCKQTIHGVFNDVIDIRRPDICGAQNNVFFVKTNEGKFAAKFTHHDMAIKNVAAARLMTQHKIPVPNVQYASIGGTCVEYYPLVDGKTLYEHIRAGMPVALRQRAYEDILTQFLAMENIPTSEFITDSKSRRFHDMAYENLKITNGDVIATIMRPVAYLANCGREHNIGLYHSDITPKNVIVNEDGRLVAFLDMDAITLCNRNYAFSVMADKWDAMGFDAGELCARYEQMSGRPLNRARINTMLRGVALFKKAMYHASRLRGK